MLTFKEYFIMENVEIQLQQEHSGNWNTFQRVADNPLIILRAMEELKHRYPRQAVRAMSNGMIVNILP